MKQWLEELHFGNPTRAEVELLQQKTAYDYLLPDMFKASYPSNISTTVQDELDVLIEYQKQYRILPKSVKQRYEFYDKNLEQAIANYVYNKCGIDVKDMLQEMFTETIPLILKLKYKFQRPRPYQVAEYYKKSVFPMLTETAINPSYPSGHVMQVAMFVHTFGNIHPRTYNDLKQLQIDVCEQRLFYGVHFPSDCDAAIEFAKIITSSKEWTSKYNI